MRNTIRKSVAGILSHSDSVRQRSLELANWWYGVRKMEKFWRGSLAPDRRFQILIYHRVMPEPEPLAIDTIRLDDFERQMKLLSTHFRPITIPQLLQEIEQNTLKPNTVCVTFDDGYKDNYAYGYPILKKHDIPATIFLTTGVIDTEKLLWHDYVLHAIRDTHLKSIKWPIDDVAEWSLDSNSRRRQFAFSLLNTLKRKKPVERSEAISELLDICEIRFGDSRHNEMLSWKEIRRMYANGVAFGAHTVTHPILSLLDEDEIMLEVSRSKQTIEQELDDEVDIFAYPNGRVDDFDERVKHILKSCGFRCALTTILGLNTCEDDPFEWHRATPWEKGEKEFWTRLIWMRIFHS